MIYCLRMDRIIPNLKLFLVLLTFSFLIFILDLKSLLGLPKSLFSYVTNPISLGLYQTNQNISRQFYFIFRSRFAAQENRALKEQVGQLLSENALLRKKLAESLAVLSQEKHLDPAIYKMIPARLIGIGRYLKIDKGISSGIRVGEAVVTNDNYIGRIVQVSEKSANVQSLADPDSKIAAFSQGLMGKAKGILVGRFGSEIIFDKILHEEKISIGDLVYSEGLGGFLPRGLILGKVVQVMERENEVFKQAKVQSNFDIRDLELVFVIQE